MKVAALFSGGKDSLYSIYLTEKKGVTVDNLITLLPTLPWPSPHAENLKTFKILSAVFAPTPLIAVKSPTKSPSTIAFN